MNSQIFIDKLKIHLQKNELKIAFEALGEVLRNSKSSFENDHILLANRFHHLSAETRSGRLDFGTAQQGRLQIVYAFTNMLDDLLEDIDFKNTMQGFEEETVHRNQNQVEDLLDETLKRHNSDLNREVKQWFLENDVGIKIVEISTTDMRPQGSFISQKNSISFGRSENCEIVIYDPYFSRKHAELVYKNNKVWLIDRGSANGTYFQNTRIKELFIESSGEIRLDQTFFNIRLL